MAEPSADVRRVLVLYTGGTIGMVRGPRGYEPVPGHLADIVRRNPQLHDDRMDGGLPHVLPVSRLGARIAYCIEEYAPLLDSSNIAMRDWERIASDVARAYDEYDAFVVLHGTDTMAFTASALSFMLEDLGKPVVLTGSQIPLDELRNDGIDNLLGALLVAGHHAIPEVGLYFANRLLRGNRSVKLDASALDAFGSPNYPPLAEVGTEIRVATAAIRARPLATSPTLHTRMEPNVAALRLFPGMTGALLEALTRPPLRGLVLQTYGTGNAPDADSEFLAAIERARGRGLVIVNCTQCLRGRVDDHYAAGRRLAEAGAVGGADMTVEAALTKLAHLLGAGLSLAEVERLVGVDLRGELTVC